MKITFINTSNQPNNKLKKFKQNFILVNKYNQSTKSDNELEKFTQNFKLVNRYNQLTKSDKLSGKNH